MACPIGGLASVVSLSCKPSKERGYVGLSLQSPVPEPHMDNKAERALFNTLSYVGSWHDGKQGDSCPGLLFFISNNFANGIANIPYDWMRRIEQGQYIEYDEQKLPW